MTGAAPATETPLDAAVIEQRCARELPAAPVTIRVLEEVDSTSSEVMRWRGRTGPEQTLAVAAEYQSEGRGRRGRRWQAPPGSAIQVSLARRLRCVHGLAPLGLGCAVAVCEVLRQLGSAPVAIKWPNDIVVESDRLARPYAKLGGLLLEVTSSGTGPAVQDVVVGIGLNVSLPLSYRQRIEGEADYAVADFATIGLQGVDRNAALAALVVAILRAFERFEAQGFAAFVARWAPLDMLRGRSVRVLAADGGTREGEAAGVDAHGALLVRVPGEPEPLRVHCGEVSVRPR